MFVGSKVDLLLITYGFIVLATEVPQYFKVLVSTLLRTLLLSVSPGLGAQSCPASRSVVSENPKHAANVTSAPRHALCLIHTWLVGLFWRR